MASIIRTVRIRPGMDLGQGMEPVSRRIVQATESDLLMGPVCIIRQAPDPAMVDGQDPMDMGTVTIPKFSFLYR